MKKREGTRGGGGVEWIISIATEPQMKAETLEEHNARGADASRRRCNWSS
jgi:hypothetical protein